MNLDNAELYWTRRSKGIVNEKETERYIKELEKQVNKLKEKIDKSEENAKRSLKNYSEMINILEEKLYKEKEKNKELENADLTTVYMSGFYDGEKKWKDKIKQKIEELEKIIESKRILPVDIIEDQNRNVKWKIEALQELLQEGDK